MFICAKCKSKFWVEEDGIKYIDRCMVCATPEEVGERIKDALTIYTYNPNKKE